MAIFKVRNAKGEWVEVPAIVGPQGPAGPTQIYDGIDSELTDWALSAKQGKVLHDAINSVWNKIYPVGSIYMSIVESNPATLFGGTWERIEGQFLIGCNSTYPNGTSGGTANTTLATANLPSHSHSVSITSGNQSANHTHSVGAHSHGLNSHKHSFSATTGNQNANHTHSGTTSSNGSHSHSMWGSQSFAAGSTNGWRAVKSGDSSHADYNSWTSVDSNGAHTHTMTTGSNSASHKHSVSGTTGAASGSTENSSAFNSGSNSANHTHSVSGDTGSTGSATSFTNLPPYLAVYIWKRTA